MKKLFIILFCFFSCYINAKVTGNNEGAESISNPKSYIGDEYISKKEFARKIDLSCTVAHPYDGTEEEWEEERKKCIFSKLTFDYENVVESIKLNDKTYLTPINGINIFLKKTKEQNYPD